MSRPSLTGPARALGKAIRDSWAAPYIDHVLAGWRVVLAYALVAGGVGAVVVLLLPKVYYARTSFAAETPEPPNLSGSLAQFAGQFNLLGLGGARTPDFYSDLLTSRRVLTTLATTRIENPAEGNADSLYRIYSRGRMDSLTLRNTEKILKTLGRRLDATVDARTGVIRVELGAPSPTVAAAALDSLLAITNRFALTNLRSRASARRIFAEKQAAEARQALEAAEDSLRDFYEENRRVSDSPRLQFEEASLRRRVDLRQDLYLALSRELDQARIEEVRDTPILNVIDPPVPPSRHERPNRRALVILATLFGGFVAVGGLVLDRARASGTAARG